MVTSDLTGENGPDDQVRIAGRVSDVSHAEVVLVGDRTPAPTYRVVADEKSIGVFTSDAAGTLSFQEALIKPTVTYAVEPS